MSFQEDFSALNTPRGSRDDVVDYYRQEYPGQKTLKNGEIRYEWKSKLADDLSSKLGIKRESVLRRFQKRGGVEKDTSKKNASEYQAIGAKLPPKIPSGGYHIDGKITVEYSPGKWKTYTINEKITGDQARELAAMDDPMQGVANYWQTGDVHGEGPTSSYEEYPDVFAIGEGNEI